MRNKDVEVGGSVFSSNNGLEFRIVSSSFSRKLKDAIYYPNALRLKDFLKNNRIEDLYYGKVSLEFLGEVKGIENLVEPKHLPLPLSTDFIDKHL